VNIFKVSAIGDMPQPARISSILPQPEPMNVMQIHRTPFNFVTRE
jgi:hypothetical protein